MRIRVLLILMVFLVSSVSVYSGDYMPEGNYDIHPDKLGEDLSSATPSHIDSDGWRYFDVKGRDDYYVVKPGDNKLYIVETVPAIVGDDVVIKTVRLDVWHKWAEEVDLSKSSEKYEFDAGLYIRSKTSDELTLIDQQISTLKTKEETLDKEIKQLDEDISKSKSNLAKESYEDELSRKQSELEEVGKLLQETKAQKSSIIDQSSSYQEAISYPDGLDKKGADLEELEERRKELELISENSNEPKSKRDGAEKELEQVKLSIKEIKGVQEYKNKLPKKETEVYDIQEDATQVIQNANNAVTSAGDAVLKAQNELDTIKADKRSQLEGEKVGQVVDSYKKQAEKHLTSAKEAMQKSTDAAANAKKASDDAAKARENKDEPEAERLLALSKKYEQEAITWGNMAKEEATKSRQNSESSKKDWKLIDVTLPDDSKHQIVATNEQEAKEEAYEKQLVYLKEQAETAKIEEDPDKEDWMNDGIAILESEKNNYLGYPSDEQDQSPTAPSTAASSQADTSKKNSNNDLTLEERRTKGIEGQIKKLEDQAGDLYDQGKYQEGDDLLIEAEELRQKITTSTAPDPTTKPADQQQSSAPVEINPDENRPSAELQTQIDGLQSQVDEYSKQIEGLKRLAKRDKNSKPSLAETRLSDAKDLEAKKNTLEKQISEKQQIIQSRQKTFEIKNENGELVATVTAESIEEAEEKGLGLKEVYDSDEYKQMSDNQKAEFVSQLKAGFKIAEGTGSPAKESTTPGLRKVGQWVQYKGKVLTTLSKDESEAFASNKYTNEVRDLYLKQKAEGNDPQFEKGGGISYYTSKPVENKDGMLVQERRYTDAESNVIKSEISTSLDKYTITEELDADGETTSKWIQIEDQNNGQSIPIGTDVKLELKKKKTTTELRYKGKAIEIKDLRGERKGVWFEYEKGKGLVRFVGNGVVYEQDAEGQTTISQKGEPKFFLNEEQSERFGVNKASDEFLSDLPTSFFTAAENSRISWDDLRYDTTEGTESLVSKDGQYAIFRSDESSIVLQEFEDIYNQEGTATVYEKNSQGTWDAIRIEPIEGDFSEEGIQVVIHNKRGCLTDECKEGEVLYTESVEVLGDGVSGTYTYEDVNGHGFYCDEDRCFNLDDGKFYTKNDEDKVERCTNEDCQRLEEKVSKELERSRVRNGGPNNVEKRALGTFQFLEASSTGFGKLAATLFMSDESLAQWRANVDDFLCSTVIGGGTECWTSLMCSEYADKIPDSTLVIETASGLLEPAAHVEGERQDLSFVDGGNESNEFLYKLSFGVRNPLNSEKTLKVNVELSGEETTLLYDEYQSVAQDDTFSRSGDNILIQYSDKRYNQICLVFKEAISKGDGTSVSRVCNSIVGAKADRRSQRLAPNLQNNERDF